MFAHQPAVNEHPGVAGHTVNVASNAHHESWTGACGAQIAVRDETSLETVASALPTRHARAPAGKRDDSALVKGVAGVSARRPMHDGSERSHGEHVFQPGQHERPQEHLGSQERIRDGLNFLNDAAQREGGHIVLSTRVTLSLAQASALVVEPRRRYQTVELSSARSMTDRVAFQASRVNRPGLRPRGRRRLEPFYSGWPCGRR